jgi:hypothetical protein
MGNEIYVYIQQIQSQEEKGSMELIPKFDHKIFSTEARKRDIAKNNKINRKFNNCCGRNLIMMWDMRQMTG